jgi:hypothetical protein
MKLLKYLKEFSMKNQKIKFDVIKTIKFEIGICFYLLNSIKCIENLSFAFPKNL